jgi:hypothetical protein
LVKNNDAVELTLSLAIFWILTHNNNSAVWTFTRTLSIDRPKAGRKQTFRAFVDNHSDFFSLFLKIHHLLTCFVSRYYAYRFT